MNNIDFSYSNFYNANASSAIFSIDNRCLNVASTLDVGIFWQELQNFLDADSAWTHLKVGEVKIDRDKIALIAQLRLPIPLECLPNIATIDDSELNSIGERHVTRIARAVYLGGYETVKEMLTAGSRANVISFISVSYFPIQVSLLDIAILCGHDDLVPLLLMYWPAQEELNVNVPIPLLTSKPHLLAQLIAHDLVGALANRDAKHLSPLHYAAMNGDVETLSVWIDAGAYVNQPAGPPSSSLTPLDYAIEFEQLDAALLLLMRGATIDPNCAILALAISQGKSIKFLQLLIEQGASLTAYDDSSPLCHAIYSDNDALIRLITNFLPDPGHYIQELIEAWVKQDLYRNSQVAFGLPKAIHCLVERLCPLTANTCFNGIPLFHHVILCCDESLALTLLEKGADPNTSTSSGITALNLALIRNYQKLAVKLVREGAKLDTTDYAGNSPIWLSLQHKNTLDFAKRFFSCTLLTVPMDLIYCRYKNLKITWLQNTIANFLVNDPNLHERFKERDIVAVCAHVFDIKGDAVLPATQEHMPPLMFAREGLGGARRFIGKIGNFVRKLPQGVWPQHLQRCVYNLCKFASEDATHSDKDYLRRIRTGEPTAILSMSWMHSWNAMFYNDHMVISNFDGTMQFYRYNQSYLSEKIIASLRQCTLLTPVQEVENILLEIEQTLRATQDASCDELSSKMTWLPQEIGNCAWKSFEGVIGALLVLKAQEFSLTPFVQSLQLHFAERYISRHEKGLNLPYGPDEFLISEMVAKLALDPLPNRTLDVVQRGKLLLRDYQSSKLPYKNPLDTHPINQSLEGALNLPQLLHYLGEASRIPNLDALKLRSKVQKFAWAPIFARYDQ